MRKWGVLGCVQESFLGCISERKVYSENVSQVLSEKDINAGICVDFETSQV